MLKKHRIRKYISLLLVLFLIFQFISGTFANTNCLDYHAQKSPIVFSPGFVHTDITGLARDGRKSSFHSVSAEYYYNLIGHIYFVDNSENKLFYRAALTDYRKEINRTIPNYFHGSKYKESNLII